MFFYLSNMIKLDEIVNKPIRGGVTVKFKTFYFENYDLNIPLDISNPRYVMSMNGVDEVLSKIITQKPYTLEMTDFNNDKIVMNLLNIDVLQYKNGKLGFAIPVFIEKDYQILHDLCFDVSKNISDILLTHKDEINKKAEKK